MPTLAGGMLETRDNYDMPTASVGMAPCSSAFRNNNDVAQPPPAVLEWEGVEIRLW